MHFLTDWINRKWSFLHLNWLIILIFVLYYETVILIFFRAKTWTSNLHSVSNARTRKRVSFQPLLNPTAKNRDCSCTVLNRTPNQNLVPEPKNEVEERKQVKAWWRRRLRRLPTRVAIKQKLSIVKASIFFDMNPLQKNNPSLENATRFNCIQFQIFMCFP